MGKKCDRVTAGIIGGGVTGKATRPTGGLTLRVKRSGRRHSFQTFLSAAREKMERFALKEPDGRDNHSACASLLRQSVGCPVLPPLAHSRPLLSQMSTVT